VSAFIVNGREESVSHLIFRPLVLVRFFLTHGLRRELHSYAASRLLSAGATLSSATEFATPDGRDARPPLSFLSFDELGEHFLWIDGDEQTPASR
jgi:hypothetical protein